MCSLLMHEGARRKELDDGSTDKVSTRVGGEERVALIVYWFVWRNVHPETIRYME